MSSHEWTRRQAIQRGGALIAGVAGVAGLGASPGILRPRAGSGPAGHAVTTAADTADAADPSLFWNFVSRPDLTPPRITVSSSAAFPQDKAGYIFVAPHQYPNGTPTQPGGHMIMDWDGQVVWYTTPQDERTDNFSLQSYRGKPVLAWFSGLPHQAGSIFYTAGIYQLADQTYTPIASIAAVGDGYAADNHECLLTPRGTAYIIVGRLTSADLTPIGGPADGAILDSGVQEIDVATGDLLFQWNGLDNIPVDETNQPYSAPGPTDLYHFNSVAIAPDGDLLISSRNTCAVYKVSRSTGKIVWRLGGRRSSFEMGPGAGFLWQHDVRPYGNTVLSVFDDEASEEAPQHGEQSRAIFLHLDTGSMRASLIREYTRPGGVLAQNQGKVQVLEGGRILVGWGSEPYMTEFSADGQVLWDAQFPVPNSTNNYQSYRALNYDWTGAPVEPPAAAAVPDASGGGSVVYASWNGATAVRRWTVLAGADPSSLAPAGTAARAGFETGIPVTSAGPYFAAVAQDARGRELGRSGPVTLSGS